MPEIQFGPFLPDNPDFKNPGCIKANNCYPSSGGYSPFRGGGTTSGSTSGVCRGAKLLARSTGDAITVGGADDKLWVDISGTVTATTGLSSIGTDDYWQFHQFNQYAFAVGPNNDLQYLTDIDSDTSWSAVSDAPEQARVIGQVGEHLMVGNLTSGTNKVQWSGLNDPITFTADAINLAGSASLDRQYGKVTGIAGDRYPVIFQEYGANRIEFVGPPSVFRITPIEEGKGAIAPGSIVVRGFQTYFLSHDGFYVTNGADFQPIGSQRVNDFFLSEVSQADMFRTHGAIDWVRRCIVWTFYPEGGSGFEREIVYHWETGNWSTAALTVHWLLQGTTDAITWDGLDALYSSIGEVEEPFDSSRFKARGRNLSAYLQSGSDTVLTALNGASLQAEFETGEAQLVPMRRSFVDKVYPLVEDASEGTQASIVTRNQKGGIETVSAVGTLNAAGFCPVRADGRYVRARLTIPAGSDWDKAQGVQISARASGGR